VSGTTAAVAEGAGAECAAREPDSEEAAVERAVERLADRCRQCYQCGQCTAACPSGWELDHGPRQVVRHVLAGETSGLLALEDVWRCSECGQCTADCPMEVPVHEVMASVRLLQLRYGGPRCAERAAAEVAARWLARHARVDNLAFGAAMVARGHVPRDPAGSAATAAASVRGALTRATARVTAGRSRGERPVAGARIAEQARPGTDAPLSTAGNDPVEGLAFFTGCALPQDPAAGAATAAVARELGLCLADLADAGCCGHPARGAHRPSLRADGPVVTVCPACDASLGEAGLQTVPLWEVLVERAARDGRRLRAAGPAFVPYTGCLVDRDRGLDLLRRSAGLAGAAAVLDHPGLHAACCGALGAVFRGETAGSRRLLAFAAERRAPVVTTCLLCRDSLRSAARRLGADVAVHFWPEFFSAERPDPGAAHV